MINYMIHSMFTHIFASLYNISRTHYTIYSDLAFSLAAAYAWQSFADLGMDLIVDDKPKSVFISRLIYTILIVPIFTQLGIELNDLKKARVFEAKQRHFNQ